MSASAKTTAPAADLAGAARRNLLLLAVGMAALYAMVELVFGVAAPTFEKVAGSGSLAGLAPAIFLASAALAALPAGQAMDRLGRRPVLAGGFAAGLGGCLLAALGTSAGSLPAAIGGFALTGVATGVILLSRAAAADMFPPDRRPRAIGQVLFGAVFGALLGSLVFAPLIGNGDGASALDLAWLGGAGFMAAGLILIWHLRPDPTAIARALAAGDGQRSHAAPEHTMPPARPLRVVAASSGVPVALLAVLASWAAMVTAMSLVGSALIDHGHEHGAVFPVLAAHFVGMFAFFILVGRVIGRIGRARAITLGLLVIAASSAGLAASVETIHLAALALFGVGLGWSLSFVAATAELSERVAPGERATVIGFADLLGNLTGAALVVAGGAAVNALGVVAIGVAAALPLLAALWIARLPVVPEPATG